MATLLARSADTIEMLSEKARADTLQSCFNCDHYEPKGWCNLFEDTVSPNYKCCSEFAEIKPYENEIKALHKDHQEPYCEVVDTPHTEETCERCVYVRGSQWCQGCNGTPKRWDGEKIVDTPQTEMDKCYKCKWWNYSYGCSNKKGICDFEQADTPQTDCGWGKPIPVSHSEERED